MASDRIVLTVPAREEYARTVRMTAVALVGRLGVPIDLVDDVRIAVEEAYVFAVRRTQPGGDVTFTFTRDLLHSSVTFIVMFIRSSWWCMYGSVDAFMCRSPRTVTLKASEVMFL